MIDPGATFRDMHRPGDPFVLANAWDVGSARVLAALGARAIGTSSAAHAFTLGRPDGEVSRDEALSHAEALVAATPLPVSGDFEDGWGAAPEHVAETVRLAAEVGLAGISIEDTPGGDAPPYPAALAAERIRAGASAARGLGRDFVLCARADGVMTGHYDLEEALARIRSFDAAGADCLYVPVPGTLPDLVRVVRATRKPVNALATGPIAEARRNGLAAAGVARISLGSTLARTVHATLEAAGRAAIAGDFGPLVAGLAGDEVDALLRRGSAGSGPTAG